LNIESIPEIYAIISVVLLLSAVFSYKNTRTFIVDSDKTIGKIVSSGVKNSTDFSKIMYVKIEIEVNDEKYIVKSAVASFQRLSVGSSVEMLYSINSPMNAKINSPVQLYFFDFILFFFGAVFLATFFMKL